MPRQNFECDPTAYYHVTARSINKDWFSTNLEFVWTIMENELYFIKHGFGIEIYAFVLMNNHYHLIVSAPRGNLSAAMAFFQKQTSRQIVKKANRINNLWAQRFKRTKIMNNKHLLNTYKYVYQNPLRANITDRCERYKFSTLKGMLGERHLLIPLSYDFIFFEIFRGECLAWLNSPIQDEDLRSMSVALKKRNFSYPSLKKKKNPLEDELI